MLLGQTPPMLVSPKPWMAYCSIHILVSFLAQLGILQPGSKVIETVCPILDAVTKSGAIIAAVTAAQQHSNPAVSQSLTAQLIVGAIAPVGGATAAGMLNVWDADWHLSTPSFLKSGNGVFSTLDIWSGAMSAAIFGALTAVHPNYQPFYTSLGLSPKGIMTPLGARSIVVIFLTILYSVRVIYTQYLVSPKTKVSIRSDGAIVRNQRAQQATPSKKNQ